MSFIYQLTSCKVQKTEKNEIKLAFGATTHCLFCTLVHSSSR